MVAYRFCEKVFRRFEPALAKAVEKLPDVTVFDPHPLEVTTFSRKLRDAKTSLLSFGWRSRVDLEKLKQFPMVIAEFGDKVVAGSQEALLAYRQADKSPVGRVLPTATQASSAELRHLVIRSTVPEVVHAAVVLKHFGEVDSLVLPPNVNITELVEHFDLVYEKSDEQITII
jgi:hypothetical protein